MSNLLTDLKVYDKPLPRYTSYPTAPLWYSLTQADYVEHLSRIEGQSVSVYIHVPFCHSMCLYCGCSVVLNRKRENEERYVAALQKEIRLLPFKKKEVTQLHFGGGTPTKLTVEDFQALFETLQERFVFSKNAEIAIEIDPRTVFGDGGEKLRGLKRVGFNRVSFGVQDTDQQVQEAVKRRQTRQMTEETFHKAREIGFEGGINVDLIYGLPYQTEQTFRQTAEEIVALGPDRIALFSYAKVPWLKAHQKAIKDETLPTTEEKFHLYIAARETFLAAGYVALGMDHFAKKEDSLSLGIANGTLGRNFQGYTLKASPLLIPLGLTAVGDLGSGYFQNEKELDDYYGALEQNRLPIHRGMILKPEDQLRRYVIHTLMCRFKLDKKEFEALYHEQFDVHFAKEVQALQPFIDNGFVIDTPNDLQIVGNGQLFVRNIVSAFDEYLPSQKHHFSKAV